MGELVDLGNNALAFRFLWLQWFIIAQDGLFLG
jgi:hypothetical protein